MEKLLITKLSGRTCLFQQIKENIKNITLAQNGKTLSKRQINSENFNIFSDVVKNLSISEYEDLTVFTSDITDPLLRAKAKYKNHLNCQTNQKYA